MRRIAITTPARLHLGQIDLNGSLGRKFGGMGVAIAEPQVRLEANEAEQLKVDAVHLPDVQEITKLAKQYLNYFNIPNGIEIKLISKIPRHIGMGSTTQLSLAIGIAITKLFNKNSDLSEIAQITDRGGSRSGIGVGAFQHGGFMIDGGKPVINGKVNNAYLPPIILREDFPQEWCFVIAIPAQETGISGVREELAFKKLLPMPEENVGQICRVIMLKMLPALKKKNIIDFGSGLTEIQRIVGEHFQPIQKGTYANVVSANMIKFFLNNGACGAGQSSWGPTVYALVEKENAADLLVKTKQLLGNQEQSFIAEVINEGALIKEKITRRNNNEKTASSVG